MAYKLISLKTDVYEELKIKASKWEIKETPHNPTNLKYCGPVGMIGYCKCGENVIARKKYCENCGQKLDWSNV